MLAHSTSLKACGKAYHQRQRKVFSGLKWNWKLNWCSRWNVNDNLCCIGCVALLRICFLKRIYQHYNDSIFERSLSVVIYKSPRGTISTNFRLGSWNNLQNSLSRLVEYIRRSTHGTNRLDLRGFQGGGEMNVFKFTNTNFSTD